MPEGHDPKLAPSDPAWHHMYVKASLEISRLLDELQNHPAMKDAEDLGDWVEALATLNSFRPRTRDNIERQASTEWLAN